MLETFLLIQLIACAMMTGIIWIVQVAIYPLFADLGDAEFDKYHTRYMKLVTYIIAPTMLVEAGTCAACFLIDNKMSFLLPTLLLAACWLSTAFLQVPQHSTLKRESVPALVRGNWIRTIAWSARTGLLGWLVLASVSA